MVPLEYTYLAATSVLLVIWLVFYVLFPSLRREMLIFSVGIGFLSVATSYYWWTYDWWHPLTITGTRVGIEDFLAGFGSGGPIAIAYEGIFKKQYFKRKSHHHYPSAKTLLLLLAILSAWLFWGVGITSFWASTVAMLAIATVMFYYRRDLLINGIASGTIISALMLIPYYVIQVISPTWISTTYNYEYLSGLHLTGIPIEEIVFWFLAGLVFGPFYEYWQGQYLEKARPPKHKVHSSR